MDLQTCLAGPGGRPVSSRQYVPVLSRLVPHVTRHRQAMAAVLAHDLDEVLVVARRVEGEGRVGVGVLVGYVPDGPEVAWTGSRLGMG